jgi:diguanylate cyclase (GGDEF)-like protein
MTTAPCIEIVGQGGFASILGMMAAHGATAEILSAVCQYLADGAAEPVVAFFVFRHESWGLEAHSQSAVEPADLLRIAASVARPVFVESGEPFARGWARHLYSGAGELLGMLAAFCSGPISPFGAFAARVESACRLAVVALEQNNLMTEVAYCPPAEVSPRDEELSLQDVARMIAQHCPPSEVLASLCAKMRLAFFLVRDDVWTLAAKGDLDACDEAVLERLDPASLSDSLFDASAAQGCPTDFGWARHLCSETGELLGMLTGFAGGPALPTGDHATRIESACRLGSLAVEQFNLIDELRFQARHDAVTGLFNRNYYERALASLLERRRVALLYANLDRFRLVNDILGLSVGTRLLKLVGFRLRQCLRADDLLARVGGDEFALILADVGSREEAQNVADRLLQSLAAPFTIDGHELFITASVGVASSTPESTAESLERAAYLALYHAKKAGKARVMFFHAGMSATPPERLEIEKRLRGAIGRSEMVLFYQPQMDLASNRIRGAEALMRWRQEGFGLVSPGVFLPVLEETGLIVEFGRWALREACRQGKQWLDDAGLEVRIGVNVSALQLADPAFAGDVQAILDDTGYPARLLELELTESLLVAESGPEIDALRRLANSGIQLALDDFGTGHSCLSYLHRLPFERLKIDQSFVRTIAADQECPPLLEEIIRMAGSLGMATIAEGIETARQADLLRGQGCGEGQGYYFSRPISADQFLRFCLQ